MALVIPQGFAYVAYKIRREADPDPYFVTLGVAVTGPVVGDPVAVTQLTSAGDALAGVMSDDERGDGILLRIGQDGEPLSTEIPWATAGTNDGANVLPPNCAVLVRKVTTLGGRRGRGRLYWPSISENVVGPTGQISESYVTTLQTAFDAFHDALGETTSAPIGGMVLLHDSGGAPPVPDPTPVTSLIVQDLIATQRRRLR